MSAAGIDRAARRLGPYRRDDLDDADTVLTPRERQIASAVGRGLTNKQIADELELAKNTVKFHLSSIYRKLDVESRLQLFVWSIEQARFEDESRAAAPRAR